MTPEQFAVCVEQLGEPIEKVILGRKQDSIEAFWQPVFDRVLADCVYGNNKGCLDAAFLNRNEANISYLKYVTKLLKMSVAIERNSAFAITREKYVYYEDLRKLVSSATRVFHVFKGTLDAYDPIPFGAGERITYVHANRLEAAIWNTYVLQQLILEGYQYANDMYSGHFQGGSGV